MVFSKDGEYFVARYFSQSSGGTVAKVLIDGTVEWVRPGSLVDISDDGGWVFTTTGTETLSAETWTVRAFSKGGSLLAETSYTTSGHRWGAHQGIWEKGLWWLVPGDRETGWRVEWLDLTTSKPTVNSATFLHETGSPRLSYDGKFIFDGNRTVYRVTSQPE